MGPRMALLMQVLELMHINPVVDASMGVLNVALSDSSQSAQLNSKANTTSRTEPSRLSMPAMQHVTGAFEAALGPTNTAAYASQVGSMLETHFMSAIQCGSTPRPTPANLNLRRKKERSRATGVSSLNGSSVPDEVGITAAGALTAHPFAELIADATQLEEETAEKEAEANEEKEELEVEEAMVFMLYWGLEAMEASNYSAGPLSNPLTYAIATGNFGAALMFGGMEMEAVMAAKKPQMKAGIARTIKKEWEDIVKSFTEAHTGHTHAPAPPSPPEHGHGEVEEEQEGTTIGLEIELKTETLMLFHNMKSQSGTLTAGDYHAAIWLMNVASLTMPPIPGIVDAKMQLDTWRWVSNPFSHDEFVNRLPEQHQQQTRDGETSRIRSQNPDASDDNIAMRQQMCRASPTTTTTTRAPN